MDIQQAMTSQCDNPIMLLLDPSPGPGRRDLPLAIFESETHVVEGKTTHQASPGAYHGCRTVRGASIRLGWLP